MIKVTDLIYGTVELPQIFEDLLASKAMQRLNDIHHSGAIFLVNPAICHKRLEHSIGVMLLIRLLGGSELEQIAGLLHDISHTTFSHVGDYVVDNKEEDYHEQLFESVLMESEIPVILERYGYHIDMILNGDFPILEQPLPDLCADRLDYTLRDAMHAKLITQLEAKSFIALVVLNNNKIFVKNEDCADWINHTYKRLNKEVFNAPLYVYANQQMALLLRGFIESGHIKETDLLKDDTFLLNKIKGIRIGVEGLRAIQIHQGYPEFLVHGASLKIKPRHLRASVLNY